MVGVGRWVTCCNYQNIKAHVNRWAAEARRQDRWQHSALPTHSIFLVRRSPIDEWRSAATLQRATHRQVLSLRVLKRQNHSMRCMPSQTRGRTRTCACAVPAARVDRAAPSRVKGEGSRSAARRCQCGSSGMSTEMNAPQLVCRVRSALTTNTSKPTSRYSWRCSYPTVICTA